MYLTQSLACAMLAGVVVRVSGVEEFVARLGVFVASLAGLYAVLIRPVVKAVGRVVDRLESIESLAGAVAKLSVRVGVVEDQLGLPTGIDE